MTFNILSVAENDGDSNSMAATQTQHSWSPGINVGEEKLYVKIDVKRNITIKASRAGRIQNTIQFSGLDLNSFIRFLEEVRMFISEEEMIAILKQEK